MMLARMAGFMMQEKRVQDARASHLKSGLRSDAPECIFKSDPELPCTMASLSAHFGNARISTQTTTKCKGTNLQVSYSLKPEAFKPSGNPELQKWK